MTKVLITGSRDWFDYATIRQAIVDAKATEIAQGGASGADHLALRAAKELGLPCQTYVADWAKHRKAAGIIRNVEMLADYQPDIVLAFWDGKSKGTQHMIDHARGAGYALILYKQLSHGIVRLAYHGSRFTT